MYLVIQILNKSLGQWCWDQCPQRTLRVKKGSFYTKSEPMLLGETERKLTDMYSVVSPWTLHGKEISIRDPVEGTKWTFTYCKIWITRQWIKIFYPQDGGYYKQKIAFWYSEIDSMGIHPRRNKSNTDQNVKIETRMPCKKSALKRYWFHMRRQKLEFW